MFDDAGLSGVVCCDWSIGLAKRAETVPTQSVEREIGVRRLWSSASLEQLDDWRLDDVVRRSGAAGVVCVPYRSAGWLSRSGYRLAAAPAAVVEAVDDKINQRQLFRAIGIPTPTWRLTTAESARALPDSMQAVVQGRRGSLGHDTIALDRLAASGPLPFGWQPANDVIVSHRLVGPVLNATGVVLESDIDVAWPSVQLVGLDACGARSPFAYCGNDFAASASLPSGVVDAVFASTATIGDGLRRAGFLGIFGVDFIYDGDTVFALEINPRFQGSTALLTTLEAGLRRTPMVQEHLRAFGWGRVGRRRDARSDPLSGAEVVLWNAGAQFEAVAAKPSAGSQLIGFPVAGTQVEPGAGIGRLRFGQAVLSPNLTNLLDSAADLVRTVAAQVKGVG